MSIATESRTMDAVLDVVDQLIERVKKAEAPTDTLPPTYLAIELRDLRKLANDEMETLVGFYFEERREHTSTREELAEVSKDLELAQSQLTHAEKEADALRAELASLRVALQPTT